MNLVIETIKKRQSVRLYEQKPIPKDLINTIIEAGNLTPSTGNVKVVEEGGARAGETKLFIIDNDTFQANKIPETVWIIQPNKLIKDNASRSSKEE